MNFKNIGHQIASFGQKFVAFVKNDADKIISTVVADKPTVDTLTAILGPQAILIENAAYAALGFIGQTLDDAGGAVTSDLLNAKMDATVVADIKQAIALLRQKV